LHEDFVSGKNQVLVKRKAFSFWGFTPSPGPLIRGCSSGPRWEPTSRTSLLAGFALKPPDQGLCPWTPLGAHPQTFRSNYPKASHSPNKCDAAAVKQCMSRV